VTLPASRTRGSRWVLSAVIGYFAAAVIASLTMNLLTDRVLPATLIAFGPHWLATLPLLPLTFLAALGTRGSRPCVMCSVRLGAPENVSDPAYRAGTGAACSRRGRSRSSTSG
jgi:hypothetical protein